MPNPIEVNNAKNDILNPTKLISNYFIGGWFVNPESELSRRYKDHNYE
jgi:hypothetical protein